MKQAKNIRVFVYGSLKAGLHNHGVLQGANRVGRSYIEGTYVMLNLGGFPGLVDDTAQGAEVVKIVGELYDVDNDGLDALDCLEGHPDFYKRIKVPVAGGNAKAWVYLLPETYMYEYDQVEDGIWLPIQEELDYARAI